MFTVRTPAGARSSWYEAAPTPPPPPNTVGGPVAGGPDDVAAFLGTHGCRASYPPATAVCARCERCVRRVDAKRPMITSTPRQGLLCTRCQVQQGGRCWL